MEGTPPKCLLFRRRRRREIFGESVHSRGKTHLKQLGRGLPISPDVVVEAVSRSVCELIPPHVILSELTTLRPPFCRRSSTQNTHRSFEKMQKIFAKNSSLGQKKFRVSESGRTRRAPAADHNINFLRPYCYGFTVTSIARLFTDS